MATKEQGIGGTRITLSHIEQAAKWAIKARKARKPIKIAKVSREFMMKVYDDPIGTECKTACCIMGAAALLAGYRSRRVPGLWCSWVTTAAEKAHIGLYEGDADERRLASAMGIDIPESNAPERALKAIAKIRKARKARRG